MEEIGPFSGSKFVQANVIPFHYWQVFVWIYIYIDRLGAVELFFH